MNRAIARESAQPAEDRSAASDVVCAVRAEMQGRTAEAVLHVLRARFDDAEIEISDGELQRVASDIARSRLTREPAREM